MDSLCIIKMTSVLYPPPMSTYERVLRDLYIGGVQDTMKYGSDYGIYFRYGRYCSVMHHLDTCIGMLFLYAPFLSPALPSWMMRGCHAPLYLLHFFTIRCPNLPSDESC